MIGLLYRHTLAPLQWMGLEEIIFLNSGPVAKNQIMINNLLDFKQLLYKLLIPGALTIIIVHTVKLSG